MIQTITDAMRQTEERPLHWSELPDAPDSYADDCELLEPEEDVDDGPGLCENCGRWPARCVCDRLYEEDRGTCPDEPLEHDCGRACTCDWYYEDRDDRGDDPEDDDQ